MRTRTKNPLKAAPLLLRAYHAGPQQFNLAAARYTRAGQGRLAKDPGSQECVELLGLVVDRLVRARYSKPPEPEQKACLYLLDHLARRAAAAAMAC